MTAEIRTMPSPQLRAMASAALAQSNLLGCETALRELIRRDPRDVELLIHLSDVLQARGMRHEALLMTRRAVAAAPRDPRAQFAMANAQFSNGSYESALRGFEAVLRTSPQNIEAMSLCAQALERTRQYSRARDMARGVLALQPDHGRALNLLGELDVTEGNLASAESLFQAAFSAAREPGARSRAWHLLGELREKQGRWDEAFEFHDKGNRATLATEVARHTSLVGPVFPFLSRTLTGDQDRWTARWSQQAPCTGPPDPVFLVGFPRSGTTLTEQVLAALPSAVTSDEEPVLETVRVMVASMTRSPDGSASYMDGLDALSEQQIREIRNEYWRSVSGMLGPEALQARLFVDKQPLRFVYLALLNRIFPRSKIIFVIRDPRDCCLSCFFQDFAPFGPMARSTTLEGIGDLYAEVMTFWMRARTKISLPYLEVRYEDMVADFEPHARRLVEFVGREWTDDVLRFHEKAAGRAIRTPSFRAVAQKINTRAVGKWAHYEKHLGPLIERVRPFLEPLGYEE